ncbi:unnamed protein product [Moneuplotes crassus]|uniref:F-box protein Hrt3/FBXO9 C-terminal domain-containing protein n=1 Tax=Euplotes crassus TaxID=5936 RepID=A0AAD1XQ12_EUPCR|nr:unnamed protein product [Moneuplotes crassus]
MEQTEEQSLHHLHDVPEEDLLVHCVSDTQMKQEEDELENDLTLDTAHDEVISWSEDMPRDIVIFIFKYLDCKTLTKVAMTNSFWYELYTSKEIQKCFKIECLDLFEKTGIYSATKKYMTIFQDWKNMFIFRPRVRCDGAYFAKVEYWHDGLTEFGDYHPIHKVTYYNFLCFRQDGKVCYTSTHYEPQIFLEKLKRKKVEVDFGTYSVKNDCVEVHIPKNKTIYVHKYALQGSMGNFSDSFVLKAKSMINEEAQYYKNIKLDHSKAIFEFQNQKMNIDFDSECLIKVF